MSKKKDLTGQRFGRLAVKRETDKRRSGCIIWECLCDCGSRVLVASRNLLVHEGGTRSCGCIHREIMHNRSGTNHPKWKGGRKKDKNGYIYITLSPRDRKRFKKKRKAEHRMVMEVAIGRKLESFESVHHKNGIRDDNRLENLELWSSHHPPGQRVSDLTVSGYVFPDGFNEEYW